MNGKGSMIRPRKYGKHLKLLNGKVEFIQTTYIENLTSSSLSMLTKGKIIARTEKIISRGGKGDRKHT